METIYGQVTFISACAQHLTEQDVEVEEDVEGGSEEAAAVLQLVVEQQQRHLQAQQRQAARPAQHQRGQGGLGPGEAEQRGVLRHVVHHAPYLHSISIIYISRQHIYYFHIYTAYLLYPYLNSISIISLSTQHVYYLHI